MISSGFKKFIVWFPVIVLVLASCFLFVSLDCLGMTCIVGIPIGLAIVALPLGFIVGLTKLVSLVIARKVRQQLAEFVFITLYLILFLVISIYIIFSAGSFSSVWESFIKLFFNF